MSEGVGLFYYGLSFSLYFIVVSFFSVKIFRRLSYFISALLPVFFMAVFRGDVGTDTSAYLQIVSAIQGGDFQGLELGFVFLVKFFLYLGLSPRFILVAVAIITTGLLLYSASFSERSFLLVALCVVPIFYIDMTMNGLRYGLAFTCAMCATGFFYRRKFLICIIFAFFSVNLHVSSWLIFILLAFLSDDKDEFKRWISIVAGLGLVILVMNSGFLELIGTISSSRPENNTGVGLQGKVYAYSGFSSPSVFSGLAPLFISLVSLALIAKVDCAGCAVCARRFYVLLSLVFIFFLIAKLSYAGLRLQFVLLFVMLLCLQFKSAFLPMEEIRTNKKILWHLYLIGILGIASLMKNIWMSEGVGPSPWLPYSVSPEILDAVQALCGGQLIPPLF